MGSGGSLTLWSPSNEAGALGYDRCRARRVCDYIWAGSIAAAMFGQIFKAVVDGGTLRFLVGTV
jgi:hypothetical protein